MSGRNSKVGKESHRICLIGGNLYLLKLRYSCSRFTHLCENYSYKYIVCE